MNTPSRYAPIWAALKLKEQVKLAAPREAHLRLKRAIIKRKNIDIGYKILCSERGQEPKLHFKSEGNLLIVTLDMYSKLSCI